MQKFTRFWMLTCFTLLLATTSTFVMGQAFTNNMSPEQKIAYDQQQSLNDQAAPMSNTVTFANGDRSTLNDFIEIGDGLGYGTYPSYYGPFANYWENAHTQTLYLASEIGGAKTITDLAWNFERVATPDNWWLNLSIKLLEVTDAELASGSYHDMTGATEVFSSANLTGPLATGWFVFDIADFEYSGDKNLIIDVVFGDNNYYESPYFRTFKTDGAVTRSLIGYADSETPPNYDGASTYYDNLRVYYSPIALDEPTFAMTPETVEFDEVGLLDGEVFYGVDNAAYTITNLGIGELTIQTEPYFFSGQPEAFNYVGTAVYPYTINGASFQTGEQLDFEVEFAPTAGGSYTSLLVIEDNLGRVVRTFEINGSAYDIPDGDIVENAVEVDQDWATEPDYVFTDLSFDDFYNDYRLDPASASDMVCHFTVTKDSYVECLNTTGADDFALFAEGDEIIEANNLYLDGQTPVDAGSYYLVASGSGDFATTLHIEGQEPILVVNPENLDLGDVPIGAWHEGGTFEVFNDGGQFIPIETAVLSDENGVYSMDYHFTLPTDLTTQTLEFDINLDAETAGIYNAAFLLTDDVTTHIYPITANAYVPVIGDVLENPIIVDFAAGSFADANTVAAPMHDNYHMEDGYGDVVYKFSYATDMVIDIANDNGSLMAIYSAADVASLSPEQLVPIAESATGDFTDLELWAGEYYLVLGGDPAVTPDYNITFDVVDMPVPGDIVLDLPVDGATEIPVRPTLEWTLGDYTSTIDLYVGTTYPPTTKVLDGVDAVSSYEFEEPLQPAQIYFWKVVAHNTNGFVESTTWAFTTTLPAPHHVTGEIFDYVNVHLEWIDPMYNGFKWTEDFEGGELPDGWTSSTVAAGSSAGWMFGDALGSSYFSIPSHTNYAATNDDANNDDGSMDYLVTGEQDFSGYDQITLTFESFYDGGYGQIATVELSTDGGITWETAYTLEPNDSWTEVVVDLTEYATVDYSSVLIAFHSDDNGSWASGWAIDDVLFESKNTEWRSFLGYNVYQNGVVVNTELIQPTEYDVLDLAAGTYVFGVSAVYNEGESAVTEIAAIDILGMSGVDGTVTDVDSGDGIEGATVTISANSIEQEYVVTTDAAGDYSTDVAVVEGGYTVTVHAGGYVDQSDENVVVVANTYTTIDFVLGETPMPVSDVVAVANASDTEATVTWSEPSEYPVYELSYDDGVADNATCWNAGYEGNMNAIRFTPSGYPAIVKTAKVHIYDGTWPAGNILSPTELVVLDDDGGDGMPGTELGSITFTPTDYNWVEVDFSAMNIVIPDGDFYIAQRQISTYPNCPPTGIAGGTPANRSYSYSGGAWGVASYDCFMIRAGISGPRGAETINYDGKLIVKETRNEGAVSIQTAERYPGVYTPAVGNVVEITPAAPANRALTGYEVYRFERTDIDTPANWDLLATVTATEYVDTDWAMMTQGVYYYAVKAIYTITEADAVLSNQLPKNMYCNAVFMLSLDTGDEPTGALVKLENINEPEYVYEAVSGPTGTINFPEIWKGEYLMTVALEGFTPIFENLAIVDNYFVKNVLLHEAHATPINLESSVDCEDVHLTWAEGSAGSIEWTQDFEGDFPPEGWSTVTNGAGWEGTNNGSSSYWTIPNHTKYACANDDAYGSGNDGSNDYLITPIQGFTGFTSGTLSFASFYTGAYSQAAYVELSTDGGATWEVIYTVTASDSWENITIDLAEYLTSEYAQVLIGFHADDNGAWASGWAIDDVALSLGIGAVDSDREFVGYNVYRDDVLLTEDPITETEYYDYGLTGGYYNYFVTAAYATTGESDPSNIASVEIEVINPAQNLTAEQQSWNNVLLQWEAPADQPIYTLQWDNGENYTAIGTNGAFDFDVASRWYPEDLGAYDGMWLTEVSFFPNEANCDYYIRVYTGSEADIVVDQAVASPTIGEWNTVVLDTPVPIDASQEFWFGYRANATAGFPAGCDAGPAVAGNGDMIYDAESGWLVMSVDYGLNYNWNIAGTVVSGARDMSTTLTKLPDVDRVNNSKASLSTSDVINNNPERLVTDRDIIGYNVFRNEEQINEEIVNGLWYIDYDLPVEPGVGGIFDYTVVAEYASGCPAAASNVATVTFGTNVGDDEGELINIYPNPAISNVNVTLTDNIESLRVMNYLGQVVYNQSITSENVVNIKTNDLVAGAYLIQLTTNEGAIINKRFIIAK